MGREEIDKIKTIKSQLNSIDSEDWISVNAHPNPKVAKSSNIYNSFLEVYGSNDYGSNEYYNATKIAKFIAGAPENMKYLLSKIEELETKNETLAIRNFQILSRNERLENELLIEQHRSTCLKSMLR